MHPQVKKYLSENGRKGGAKSKRKITPEQQKAMQDAKRARSAMTFKEFAEDNQKRTAKKRGKL